MPHALPLINPYLVKRISYFVHKELELETTLKIARPTLFVKACFTALTRAGSTLGPSKPRIYT